MFSLWVWYCQVSLTKLDQYLRLQGVAESSRGFLKLGFSPGLCETLHGEGTSAISFKSPVAEILPFPHRKRPESSFSSSVGGHSQIPVQAGTFAGSRDPPLALPAAAERWGALLFQPERLLGHYSIFAFSPTRRGCVSVVEKYFPCLCGL